MQFRSGSLNGARRPPVCPSPDSSRACCSKYAGLGEGNQPADGANASCVHPATSSKSVMRAGGEEWLHDHP